MYLNKYKHNYSIIYIYIYRDTHTYPTRPPDPLWHVLAMPGRLTGSLTEKLRWPVAVHFLCQRAQSSQHASWLDHDAAISLFLKKGTFLESTMAQYSIL